MLLVNILSALMEWPAYFTGHWWKNVWFKLFFWGAVAVIAAPFGLLALGLVPLCIASFIPSGPQGDFAAEKPVRSSFRSSAFIPALLISITVAGAVWWAVSHRYQVSYDGALVRRMDRWTGNVSVCVLDVSDAAQARGQFIQGCLR